MHFTQMFAAIMALPALSIAAAVPRSSGFQPCSNFATLTVGTLYVNTQNLILINSVDVRIRPDGSGEEGWRVIATVPKGSNGYTIDAGQYPGVWNLEVCDSTPYPAGGLCVAPAGYNKLWRFRASGDRWYFNTLIKEGLHRTLYNSECSASDLKVTDTPTVTVTATPTTTSVTSTRTSSNSSTITSVRTTSSSTRASSSSTRTSSSSTRTSTSTRRN